MEIGIVTELLVQKEFASLSSLDVIPKDGEPNSAERLNAKTRESCIRSSAVHEFGLPTDGFAWSASSLRPMMRLPL